MKISALVCVSLTTITILANPYGQVVSFWHYSGREVSPMALTNTERSHSAAKALDTLPPETALIAIHAAQVAAASAVEAAIPQISAAAEAVARCLADGGRLIYAGAGSSGLMAMADALEVPGTFGIAR